MVYEITVGQRLKKLRSRLARSRGRRRITQQQLADESGLPLSNIQKWETDVMVPEGKNLIRIAEVLETTPTYIMRGGLAFDDEESTAKRGFARAVDDREPIDPNPEAPAGVERPGATRADEIIRVLGDPEMVRRQAGTVPPSDIAKMAYAIAQRDQLPPQEMRRILDYIEAITGDEG